MTRDRHNDTRANVLNANNREKIVEIGCHIMRCNSTKTKLQFNDVSLYIFYSLSLPATFSRSEHIANVATHWESWAGRTISSVARSREPSYVSKKI